MAKRGVLEDLTGQRFGMLVAYRRAAQVGKNTEWWCKCDCGNIKPFFVNALKQGRSKSCGCQHSRTEFREKDARFRAKLSLMGLKPRKRL